MSTTIYVFSHQYCLQSTGKGMAKEKDKMNNRGRTPEYALVWLSDYSGEPGEIVRLA